jgi:hypothetical protein
MKNPPANPAADVLLAATTVAELHGAKVAVPKLAGDFPSRVVMATSLI